jgi:hypothetical protein
MKEIQMRVWASLMGLVVLVILTACSSFANQQPLSADTPVETESTSSSQPTTLDILKAMDPTFEVYFDGESCEVEGPSEINVGDHLFVLHNDTDLPASVTIGSYLSEGSYDDHFQWREENCGGQGTDCKDSDGNDISYSLATWYSPKKLASENQETYFKLFEVNMKREYNIWVYSDGVFGWLCAPFIVQ